MAVSPLSCYCSFKLHTKNHNTICMARSLATATTLTANPLTYSFHRNSHSINTRPRTLGVDQVLIKEHDQLKLMKIEDEGYLEKEAADVIIMRLKMVVERMREMEIRRFMNRVEGEPSDQNDSWIAAEEMSREIINKFFEKPIEYLTSDGGCLLQKLKDVDILVSILEKSCPANQR